MPSGEEFVMPSDEELKKRFKQKVTLECAQLGYIPPEYEKPFPNSHITFDIVCRKKSGLVGLSYKNYKIYNFYFNALNDDYITFFYDLLYTVETKDKVNIEYGLIVLKNDISHSLVNRIENYGKRLKPPIKYTKV